MGSVIDPAEVPARTGSGYPSPFDEPCRARSKRALGDPGGLTQFGVNLVTIAPGAWSAQRHWHSHEDEFVWVVSGELVLVTGEISILAMVGEFFVPVLAGNIIGGTALFGLLAYAQVVKEM